MRRAVKCIVRSNILDFELHESQILLYILADIDYYYQDRFINYINKKVDYTIKTWKETKEFLNKNKIL